MSVVRDGGKGSPLLVLTWVQKISFGLADRIYILQRYHLKEYFYSIG